MTRAMQAFGFFVYVFGVIFVAELPDKTAVAALVLATRYRALPVFFGTSLALTIQSLVAVAAGSLFSLLPARPVHVGAGAVFIVSGVIMWLRSGAPSGLPSKVKDSPAELERSSSVRTFATVFGVIFVAEWGDLTQLATAALAARARAPLTVFAASTLALWGVAGVAVAIGTHAAKLLRPDLIQRMAALLFAAIGVAFIAGWL